MQLENKITAKNLIKLIIIFINTLNFISMYNIGAFRLISYTIKKI